MSLRIHKRGGSAEEDPNAALRLDMASKEEEAATTEGEIIRDFEGQEEREPSLLELILIDIQTSIANITKDSEALRKDLKASLEFNDKELREHTCRRHFSLYSTTEEARCS